MEGMMEVSWQAVKNDMEIKGVFLPRMWRPLVRVWVCQRAPKVCEEVTWKAFKDGIKVCKPAAVGACILWASSFCLI